jgi:hypothetical protein
MVDRIHRTAFHYRTIKSGFYIGNKGGLVHFAMPDDDYLLHNHYKWWRSAHM